MSDETKQAVHVVTKGSYSNYRIVAVFLTHEEAEAFVQWVTGMTEQDEDGLYDGYEIEVWGVGRPAKYEERLWYAGGHSDRDAPSDIRVDFGQEREHVGVMYEGRRWFFVTRPDKEQAVRAWAQVRREVQTGRGFRHE